MVFVFRAFLLEFCSQDPTTNSESTSSEFQEFLVRLFLDKKSITNIINKPDMYVELVLIGNKNRRNLNR